MSEASPNQSLEERLDGAVALFWRIRLDQSKKQGKQTGSKDRGQRSAVTGGAQMNGFESLVRELLVEAGLPTESIHTNRSIELPGWFRAEKKWDLLVVHNGQLVAAIEFKSHIGPSFGNNANNRVEEVLGSATDLWAAYREGAFAPASRPWLGYFMLLEQCDASTKPVRVKEPHFQVFDEFKSASYQKRYEHLLTKLLRDRLYDGACFLTSSKENGADGHYAEPCPELSFSTWVRSLLGRVRALTDIENKS